MRVSLVLDGVRHVSAQGADRHVPHLLVGAELLLTAHNVPHRRVTVSNGEVHLLVAEDLLDDALDALHIAGRDRRTCGQAQ